MFPGVIGRLQRRAGELRGDGGEDGQALAIGEAENHSANKGEENVFFVHMRFRDPTQAHRAAGREG